MKISIRKLDIPVHDGDWHDPVLKWEVLGPGDERQIFYTKKGATEYKRIRAKVASFSEASKIYLNS